MQIFEITLVLGTCAVLLLQLARRLSIPYPAMLALAGTVVAFVPGVPTLSIDPSLALALFIAPALMDAAYELPPHEIRRNWIPVTSLAVMAVLLTAAAVAWLAVELTGMPWYAAVALGAIVAPPDAAAATAVLSRFRLPRRTLVVLKGESLLNDAIALLLFTAALRFHDTPSESITSLASLGLAVPGGMALGWAVAMLYGRWAPMVSGTLGGVLLEITTTFASWILAEHLHLSAILSVVVFSMVVAHEAPVRQSARDRVHSHAVWETVVFLLNVLAFLLMGLQAHDILSRIGTGARIEALMFAGAVVATVIIVRLVWVMAYNRGVHLFGSDRTNPPPTLAQGLLVSWSGMRGLVTLATALALPVDFPHRGVIVLSALAVVLGTLVVQGLTLGPLISRLKFPSDDSYDEEMRSVRGLLIKAALSKLDPASGKAAMALSLEYRAHGAISPLNASSTETTVFDDLRLSCIDAQRTALEHLRCSSEISPEVHQALLQELDWAELATGRGGPPRLLEG